MLNVSYIGPEIDESAAFELLNHIQVNAGYRGLEPLLTVIVVDSRGNIIARDSSTETGALILAEAKAITALEFMKDTIELRYRWEEHGTNSPDTGWVELDSGLRDEEISEIRKLEPRFTNLAGGVLIKSEHNAAVVGAVGVVTGRGGQIEGQSEILDHELASLRPFDFVAVAA